MDDAALKNPAAPGAFISDFMSLKI